MSTDEKTIDSQRKQAKERAEVWESFLTIRRSWQRQVWAWVTGRL